VPEGQKAVQEAVVVVTKFSINRFIGAVIFLILSFSAHSAVLPEDRADILYHKFDGGGVVIDGPSILVRKSIKDTVSVAVNYYVDNVTSASIDVVTTASAYLEEREEKSISVAYLRNKSILTVNYGQSEENDYSAKTASFDFTQDFFGDLTTITAGYSQGWDIVGKRGEDLAADVKRKQYRFGVTQIITKNSLVGMSWETITDQGLLNNPYRSVRYLDPTTAVGYSYQSEQYPETRTSDAIAIRGMLYLPYRAAIKAEARVFQDTWGIKASNYELGYTHPYGEDWVFDLKFRHYEQTKADFYSDLFSRIDAQNFLARDKEMSTFSNDSVGFAVSYGFELLDWGEIDRFSINLAVDSIKFKFEDFRDLREDATPGEESLYAFDSLVTRLFFSVWY